MTIKERKEIQQINVKNKLICNLNDKNIDTINKIIVT